MRVCVTFLHRPLDGRLSRVSRDEKQRGDKTQAKLQEEWKNEEVGRVEEKHGEQTCGEWRATTTMLGRSEPQRLLDDERPAQLCAASVVGADTSSVDPTLLPTDHYRWPCVRPAAD